MPKCPLKKLLFLFLSWESPPRLLLIPQQFPVDYSIPIYTCMRFKSARNHFPRAESVTLQSSRFCPPNPRTLQNLSTIRLKIWNKNTP
jgi:hypothetical protein